MRCKDCNARLSDFEATRKWKNTNEYFDLCDSCFYAQGFDQELVDERYDLYISEESDEDYLQEMSEDSEAE